MRPSEIIGAMPPATLAEKGRASMIGVADGKDVALSYFQEGWVNIVDSQYTLGAPRTILGGVKTQITIDGLGAATNTQYADGLHADVWQDNRFKPAALGETYNIRLTCTVAQTNAGSGHYVIFDTDIGTDVTPFITASQSISLVKGQGAATLVTIFTPYFCLDTFGRNGARLFFTPDVDITAWGFAIFIQRTFTP